MKKIIAMGMLVMVATALQALASARALAQDKDVMSEMDQDEDGMISIREAVADPVLLASFGKIDTDGDGKISQEELAASKILKQAKHQA